MKGIGLWRVLSVLAVVLVVGHVAPPAAAQSCGWFGTGPVCAGSCPAGMTEYQRSGEGCTTGTRAYCCRFQESKAPRITPAFCTRFGTGPVCAGRCPPGWTERGRPTDGCITGSRANCCDFRDYCLSNGRRVLCGSQTKFEPNPVTVMHWPFKSNYKYKAEVKFFSRTRNAVWPSDGRVFPFNDYGQYTIKLRCNVGEQICYGAWPTGTSGGTYWGVGRDGKQGCTGCCRTCVSGRVAPTVLGN